MSKYYNVEELKDLSVRLGLDFDEIPMGGKNAIVSGILDWTVRRRKVDQLLLILRQDRREPFNVEGLSLDKESIESIYQNLLKSDHPETGNPPPKKLDTKLSRADAQRKIKNLFWKMLWVRTSWLKHVDVDLSLQLKYWPVFIYQGNCSIEYRFQQLKNRVDLNSNVEKELPIHSIMQNHLFQRKTKILNISAVTNLSVTTESPDLLDSSLISALSQIVAGNKPKCSFSNSPVDSMMNLLHKSPRALKPLFWSIWDAINTGIYDNPLHRWPKFNSSKRFITSIGLPLNIVSSQISINLSEQITGFEKGVKAKLGSSIANKNYMEITNISFWGTQIYAVMLPFWVLDNEMEDDHLTILLNGWNGSVSYVYAPFSLSL